jgi:hypothetical protein
VSTATGIRTRVSAVRGRRPSPLDDSGEGRFEPALARRLTRSRTGSSSVAGKLSGRAIHSLPAFSGGAFPSGGGGRLCEHVFACEWVPVVASAC